MSISHDYLYSIKKFDSKLLPSVIRLYQRAYPERKKPHAFFTYRFLTSPYGKPVIYLAKFKNDVVGLYAIHPVQLKINNQLVLGGFSYLTMTDPKHSGKGIFTDLALRTYDFVKKKGYKFIYGFPNSNSYHGFTTRLDWKKGMKINHIMIRKIDFEINEIPQVHNHFFPRNLEKIWEKYNARKKYAIRRERSNNLINWRYKNHPIFRYLTCYKPGKYFFIFKKYENVLHIIDFLISDDIFIKTLLAAAIKTAKKTSCSRVSMWIPKNHIIMNLLKKKNIEYVPSQSFFSVLPLDQKIEPILANIKNWYYTMGDSDIF